MPLRIKPAMKIFQTKQKQVILDLKGVTCIADNILLVGKADSIEEATLDHNDNLQKLRKENLKINREI